MIGISPYHPEIDRVWQALSATGARSIAVVSAQPREGASQIAAALARRAGFAATADSLAQHDGGTAANRMALLVDLDLAQPRLSFMFGQQPQPEEIIRMDETRFALLGKIGVTAALAWRERPRLAEQLIAWQADWSTVILDTAPLLDGERRRGPRGTAANRRPEARIGEIAGITAAAAADACVLVTLAGRTTGNRIREAREKLATAGANLVGSILNDRENPSLLAELDRETYRLAKYCPDWMAKIRGRMHRSSILSARV